MADLYSVMEETLFAGGEVVFTPNGGSMRPFLLSGRNPVTLVRPGGGEPLAAFEHYRVGDVLLYRRASGQFVLHRLMKLDEGRPVFCGDAGAALEYGILPGDVLARVARFEKNRRTIDCRTNRRYRAAVALWMALFPIRGAMISIARTLLRPFWRRRKSS